MALISAEHKQKRKEYDARYREKNLEAIRKRSREWEAQYRKDNPEKVRVSDRKKNAVKYEKHRERFLEQKRASERRRRKMDPEGFKRNRRERQRRGLSASLNYKLSQALRSRLYRALGDYSNEGKISAVRHLGCTIPELILHLESLFVGGMCWDNYGKWHIDHIIPFAYYDLTADENVRKVCHYSNLQPLWTGDNLRKGSRI